MGQRLVLCVSDSTCGTVWYLLSICLRGEGLQLVRSLEGTQTYPFNQGFNLHYYGIFTFRSSIMERGELWRGSGGLGFEFWLATKFLSDFRQVISLWGNLSFLVFKIKKLNQVIFFFFFKEPSQPLILKL